MDWKGRPTQPPPVCNAQAYLNLCGQVQDHRLVSGRLFRKLKQVPLYNIVGALNGRAAEPVHLVERQRRALKAGRKCPEITVHCQVEHGRNNGKLLDRFLQRQQIIHGKGPLKALEVAQNFSALVGAQLV